MARAAQRVGSRLVVACVVLLATAYGASRFGMWEWPRRYDPLALPDLASPPNLLTTWQLSLADSDPQGCALTLQRAGLPAGLNPAKAAGTNCEVSDSVTLSRLSRARLRPEDTRCPIAARLYVWERHVLQPAARAILGEPVAEILHFGSYSCRNMRGSDRLSEHATANAFDISGFRLSSGKIISVKTDWPGSSRDARFLRAARDGLCDWFNVTLSPNYNEAHADHFHVDMGWYQTCR
jgi:hypothetical protein